MLRGLIVFCLLRRPLVLIAFGAFLGLGFVAFTALNIEAYPDPAPPIIEIIAQRPGQSPEEMERYVTIPIEIAIASTPGLSHPLQHGLCAEFHSAAVRIWPRLLLRAPADNKSLARGRPAAGR